MINDGVARKHVMLVKEGDVSKECGIVAQSELNLDMI